MMGLAIASATTLGHAATTSQAKPIKAPVAQTEVQGFTPLTAPTNGSYISDSATSFGKTQSRVYQFDLKGKWGVKFDVNQPETAPSGFNDVDAGAFYKLSPSVRVGGTVGFGEKTDPLKPEPKAKGDKSQPRVRLETTFKF
ncbi:MAG: hypothetical protein JF615_13810 [Asticcacaulis sp.]|nr:hypothetical protein [Asticcacaulis sp.]